jgi:NAD(P)-dependent dehydrogenase (short-subunit alcohol dehydrogenase family)
MSDDDASERVPAETAASRAAANANSVGDSASLDLRAENRLRGSVAVVTGAARGIGRATIRRLAAEGAIIVAADIDDAQLEIATEELRLHGVDARAMVCDVTSCGAAQDLITATIDWYGRVDILVNNVGGATALRPYWEWREEEIAEEIGRSLWPAAWCCRAVLPHMVERRRGRIVNVGAESVRNGLWDRAPYNMGKGAVHALTTSIAREAAPFGVTCNCVAPAATGSQSGRLERRRAEPVTPEDAERIQDLIERTLSTIPLGREAEEAEQAAAIAFLASEDASFITGQVLSVNGGSSMV